MAEHTDLKVLITEADAGTNYKCEIASTKFEARKTRQLEKSENNPTEVWKKPTKIL